MRGKGKPFEKGKSGNPNGRSKIDKAIEAAQKMNYTDFLDRVDKYGGLKRQELKEFAEDPETPVNDLIILRLLMDSATGKPEARKTYLERRFGKVKDYMEHSGNIDIERKKLEQLSTSELVGMVTEFFGAKK